MSRKRQATIRQTLLTALLGNIASTVVKVIFGVLANSVAMLADGLHSGFDAVSSIIGLYGNKFSSRPADLDHPYGHRKYEYIAALAITIMMFIAASNIVREAVDRLFRGIAPTLTWLSFVAITISMTISVLVSVYERKMGEKVSSNILITDSYHTLSDVFASIVVLAGFLATEFKVGYADSAAAIIVSIIMAYMAATLFRMNTRLLVDLGVKPNVLTEVEQIASSLGVSCHAIRGRLVGRNMFLDLHMSVDPSLPVSRAHFMADTMENKIKHSIGGVEDVVIHIEPRGEKCALWNLELEETQD